MRFTRKNTSTGEREPLATSRKWVIGLGVGAALILGGAVACSSGNAGSSASSASTTVTLTQNTPYWATYTAGNPDITEAGELPAGTQVSVNCQYSGTLGNNSPGQVTDVNVLSNVAAQAGPMATPGTEVVVPGQLASSAPACSGQS